MLDKPTGSIRITTSGHAARTIWLPKLAPLLRQYPDIHVELVVEQELTDIVAERYDAGVRLGEQLAKGMIAVPIGPAERMIVVGTPAYPASAPPLRRPRDLTAHRCGYASAGCSMSAMTPSSSPSASREFARSPSISSSIEPPTFSTFSATHLGCR
jgi:DNA-binding transcriptional LysR family regulator